MELKPLKVAELNHYIKRILINDVLLYNINVEGEVSNCKYHTNGHVYFSLKDQKSRVRCIMFSQDAEKVDLVIRDGMHVVAGGSIDVFERDGTYQIHVRRIRDAGKGRLYEELERLKEKLALEGLFEEGLKMPIPPNPRRIGLITSITGSTVRDMIINIWRRNRAVDIVVAPALVQGAGSVESVLEAIGRLGSRKDIDTIIIGRGGGSMEELWSFNDERIARAVHRCRIPVISAIGHETDFTILDFVADKRASTPSTAAEMAVPLASALSADLETKKARLASVMESILRERVHGLELARGRLLANGPRRNMESGRDRLDSAFSSLRKAYLDSFEKKRAGLDGLVSKLDILSPLRTLDRGYSVVQNMDMQVVKSSSYVREGDELRVLLRDGSLLVSVDKIEK